jgi:hypothetical protein
MGRKSLEDTYRPYVNEILRDLDLCDITIDLHFGRYTKIGGDVYYNGLLKYAEIRIDKGSKAWVISVLMHELRHIWQEKTGIALRREKIVKGKRGGIHREYITIWKGKEYPEYNNATLETHKDHKKYINSPWEIDARAYEAEVTRLFPNLEIPKRLKIGTIGKTTFYKMKGAE